jgi:hypothetical protein
MHTEHHIQVAGGVAPEARDDREVRRGVAAAEPRPAPAHARPLGEDLGYPPVCAHRMNSFTDGDYGLALARLRRG